MKSITNYAVTMEKTGKRNESIQILDTLKENFKDEIRIYNNLAIIFKRNGDLEAAQSNYDIALSIDKTSFFPNYNMGVLKALSRETEQEGIEYFEKALQIAHDSNEEVYEINVLVNIGLIQER